MEEIDFGIHQSLFLVNHISIQDLLVCFLHKTYRANESSVRIHKLAWKVTEKTNSHIPWVPQSLLDQYQYLYKIRKVSLQ
jgi:hypothetical protein